MQRSFERKRFLLYNLLFSSTTAPPYTVPTPQPQQPLQLQQPLQQPLQMQPLSPPPPPPPPLRPPAAAAAPPLKYHRSTHVGHLLPPLAVLLLAPAMQTAQLEHERH